MSPLDRPRRAARPQPRTALAALTATLLAGASTLPGCASSEPIGGCWQGSLGGDRTVSFFVDTDDGSVLGTVTSGEGEGAVRTDFEGRLEGSGGDYRIDASCTGGGTGCSGAADWSMRCTLDEAGDEPILRCSGAPFAAETELTSCQGSATVPTT